MASDIRSTGSSSTSQPQPLQLDAENATFLSSTAGKEVLTANYLPPQSLRGRLFNGGALHGPLGTDMSTRVREEVIIMEMFIQRTHTTAYRTWCSAHTADAVGLQTAAMAVRSKLLC